MNAKYLFCRKGKKRSKAAANAENLDSKEILESSFEREKKAEEARIEEENKRKSTGSISSLVKMWEPSSPRDASGASAVSPSLASDSERPGSVVKFEKRVWPPVPSTETEKPMVPVKTNPSYHHPHNTHQQHLFTVTDTR